MWSFTDNLDFKMEFESPVEVTALSFCPTDTRLLFGGTLSGQLILWDLQTRADNFEVEENLTAAQSRYRMIFTDALKWTIPINEETLVTPTTMSTREVSQDSMITSIQWLGQHIYVNNTGIIHSNPDLSMTHKYFISSSFDNSICFWNLDGMMDTKIQGRRTRKNRPKELLQDESIYKGKLLKPVHRLIYKEPISCFLADTGSYTTVAVQPLNEREGKTNFPTVLVANEPDSGRTALIVASYYGHIDRITWMGNATDDDTSEDVEINAKFAQIHDGPIIAMKKNPFYQSVFATIGRNIFAVWREDFPHSAVFWRKRACDLTALAWSETRPAVVYLTRIDGNFEVWDILARDDDACLDEVLGGGIITALTEHRLNEPEKLIGIGDYNSSFRMVRLPSCFYAPVDNELEKFKAYIDEEVGRKTEILEWEISYNEANQDDIVVVNEAAAEAHKEMERGERDELVDSTGNTEKSTAEGEAHNPLQSNLPYPERMRRQWERLNMRRLMKIFMSRKRVNEAKLKRDTILEKQRLQYEENKKKRLLKIVGRVAEEVAAVRARIIPTEVHDLGRAEIVAQQVDEILSLVDNFEETERTASQRIKHFSDLPNVEFFEFLRRGVLRRELLYESMGGSMQRLRWIKEQKRDKNLDECRCIYQFFEDDTGEGVSFDNLSKMSLEEAVEPMETSEGASNDDPSV